jgi:hypothetical protein
MKGKVGLKQKIWIGSIIVLLVISLNLVYVLPLKAHIPEGWCPIEECWKHMEEGAEGGAAAADISVAAMYKATSIGIDNLWDGRVPKRSDIEIISKLPTCGAKHAAQCIVGVPEGETPPEWKSDKPGRFEMIPVEGTDAKNLRLVNFEITIIRKSNGEKYTWKADADIFTDEYFECINKEASGEKLRWWEASRCDKITGKPIGKLEESIGLILSNELHDKYAHHFDDGIVGKADKEGTILYLATAIADTGDKENLEALCGLVKEASELIDEAHELIHGTLVPTAEEMGKGIHEAENLHDIAHKLLASIYRVGEYTDDIAEIEDVDEVKAKASEMLDEVKKLKGYASELHIHSTDPATAEVIEIKYEELVSYYSEMSKEKERGPIGGAIALGVVVVGLVIFGVTRRKRA